MDSALLFFCFVVSVCVETQCAARNISINFGAEMIFPPNASLEYAEQATKEIVNYGNKLQKIQDRAVSILHQVFAVVERFEQVRNQLIYIDQRDVHRSAATVLDLHTKSLENAQVQIILVQRKLTATLADRGNMRASVDKAELLVDLIQFHVDEFEMAFNHFHDFLGGLKDLVKPPTEHHNMVIDSEKGKARLHIASLSPTNFIRFIKGDDRL